jgi:bacterioferritin
MRDQAVLGMSDGPIMPADLSDADAIASLLNELLSTTVVCWLRYEQHSTVLAGIDRERLTPCFQRHAAVEHANVPILSERIVQLGALPNLDPAGLTERSLTAFRTYATTDVTAMIKENLIAARIMIQACQQAVRAVGQADPTSRRLVENILADEELQAAELRALGADMV